jgi:mycofactocin precursor peptide peptidase
VSRLATLAWPELEPTGRVLLALPLGATEQHGPHLPLDTDTRVAAALADRLAAARADVIVAPALPYGSSGEHECFPGTLSIGQHGLELAVTEVVRSATRWANGVVVISGHGGNAEPLRRAERALRAEGRRVLAWAPRLDGGDAHAGHAETSMLLALAPERVRRGRAARGRSDALASLMPAIRRHTLRAVSPSGVLGDPRGASAEQGRALLERLGAQLCDAVARWWT